MSIIDKLIGILWQEKLTMLSEKLKNIDEWSLIEQFLTDL